MLKKDFSLGWVVAGGPSYGSVFLGTLTLSLLLRYQVRIDYFEPFVECIVKDYNAVQGGGGGTAAAHI